VRAAAEGIYDKLIDEKFFISLLNGLEDVIGLVDGLIDSFGGLRGILAITSNLLLNMFSSKISAGLQDMVHNLKISTEWGRWDER
jgi:hypothetical protein